MKDLKAACSVDSKGGFICPFADQPNGWVKQGARVLNTLERLETACAELHQQQTAIQVEMAFIKRLEKACAELRQQQTAIQIEMASMKVRMGIAGAIGASVPVAISVLVMLLK